MSKIIKLLLTVMAILLMQTVVYAEDIKSVKITDGSVTTSRVTNAETVGELLEREGISLAYMDTINYDMDVQLTRNMNIIITRGYYIFVRIDGDRVDNVKINSGMLAGYLVKRLQEERNIQYEYTGNPRIVLQEGDEIEIFTPGAANKNETVTERVFINEIIPFITEIVETPELAKGTEQVVREGSEGEKRFTYEVVYTNGQEMNRTQIHEEVTVWPVSKIVYYGIFEEAEKNNESAGFDMIDDPASLIGSNDVELEELEYITVHTMNASAYSADSSGKRPSDRNYGITATGAKARYGIVAVDPSFIPLGTLVYVEGYGVALAADTGGAIKGNKIDLCFDSYAEAKSFGRKNLKVYVLS